MPDRGSTLQPTRGRSVSASIGAPRPATASMPTQQQPPQVPQFAPPQIQMPAMQAPPPVQVPQVPQGGAPPVPPPSPGGVPGSPGSPGAPTVPGGHTAFNSPEMTEYLNRIKARLDNPADDTRALNQAGQAINDFAQGQRNTANASALQRGVYGQSGAAGQISDDIGNEAQRSFGRAAENIAIQRMRDNDQFLLGAGAAFSEPGRMNLQDRALGVQAQGQAGQLDLQRARMTLDAQLANQGMAAQVAQANMQAQIQAQQMAQQQYMAMMQMYANLYR